MGLGTRYRPSGGGGPCCQGSWPQLIIDTSSTWDHECSESIAQAIV